MVRLPNYQNFTVRVFVVFTHYNVTFSATKHTCNLIYQLPSQLYIYIYIYIYAISQPFPYTPKTMHTVYVISRLPPPRIYWPAAASPTMAFKRQFKSADR